MSTSLTLIVAIDRKHGIGINNTLPWRLPEDLAFFKKTTTGHTIIMGRKTFDSIGRALPNRRNIVVTRNPDWSHEGVERAGSLDEAAQMAGEGEVFVDDDDGEAEFHGGLPVLKRAAAEGGPPEKMRAGLSQIG